MYWSTEDTFKLLGLLLFIGSFIIVLQQLLSAEARLNSNSNNNKEEEKKTEQIEERAHSHTIGQKRGRRRLRRYREVLTFRGVGYVCMYGSLSKLKENDQDRASTHTGTIYVSCLPQSSGRSSELEGLGYSCATHSDLPSHF